MYKNGKMKDNKQKSILIIFVNSKINKEKKKWKILFKILKIKNYNNLTKFKYALDNKKLDKKII
jgi:hypothetical protein